MDIRPALKSQYHAALKALRIAVEKCPDAQWSRAADGRATFSRVAYHTLFFTHFYAQQDQSVFAPWEHHRDEAHAIGPIAWEGNRPAKASTDYTKDEILDYWRFCDAGLDGWIDALDLEAPQCGFPWYTMGTLEHQLLSLRHIQHHAAALSARLRREGGVEIPWVGRG